MTFPQHNLIILNNFFHILLFWIIFPTHLLLTLPQPCLEHGLPILHPPPRQHPRSRKCQIICPFRRQHTISIPQQHTTAKFHRFGVVGDVGTHRWARTGMLEADPEQFLEVILSGVVEGLVLAGLE